mmetsp:Transcript_15098/g.39222  ORF Transcript_15098/g.39222 Transcript_15098/m.39222 type:complete len:377 (+) Transcript_15098:323-1453(+)
MRGEPLAAPAYSRRLSYTQPESLAWAQLELDGKRQVVRRELRRWQCRILGHLRLVRRLEQRGELELVLRVPDVVERADEVSGVVGEGELHLRGRLSVGVQVLRRCVAVRAKRRVRRAQQHMVLERQRREDARRVLLREVLARNVAALHQRVRRRARRRVEVACDDDGHGMLQRATRVLAHDALDLKQQVLGLPQLDVGELGVGIDVRVGDAHVRGRAVQPSAHDREDADLRDVVLEKAVEDALLVRPLLSVLVHRDRVELDRVQLPVDWHELVPPVEERAPVHLAVLAHELARLALVHARVAELVHVRLEELLVVVRLDLLQAEHVRAQLLHVPQQVAPAVRPRQGPRRAVRVRVAQRVQVGEHVVRADGDAELAV